MRNKKHVTAIMIIDHICKILFLVKFFKGKYNQAKSKELEFFFNQPPVMQLLNFIESDEFKVQKNYFIKSFNLL